MAEALATADFRLTGTGWNDAPVDETVHAELHASGAFQYGNQTCMILTWNARKGWNRTEMYDARYEKVSPQTFKEFAREALQNMVMKTITVSAI